VDRKSARRLHKAGIVHIPQEPGIVVKENGLAIGQQATRVEYRSAGFLSNLDGILASRGYIGTRRHRDGLAGVEVASTGD
jgi:Mn-dependent DtxR family transcriptional regulator